jgi:hypothetical protein
MEEKLAAGTRRLTTFVLSGVLTAVLIVLSSFPPVPLELVLLVDAVLASMLGQSLA